jgi:hypothetical protein
VEKNGCGHGGEEEIDQDCKKNKKILKIGMHRTKRLEKEHKKSGAGR